MVCGSQVNGKFCFDTGGAGRQDENAIGEADSFCKIVGDEDDSNALPVQLTQKIHNLREMPQLLSGGGLVQQKQLRRVHQGGSQCYPLALAAGEEQDELRDGRMFDDVQALRHLDIDYIGLGPLRFTATKQKLSPVLGLDGYRDIIARMKDASINLPVVAIGGITIADIEDVMLCDLPGVLSFLGLPPETEMPPGNKGKTKLKKLYRKVAPNKAYHSGERAKDLISHLDMAEIRASAPVPLGEIDRAVVSG